MLRVSMGSPHRCNRDLREQRLQPRKGVDVVIVADLEDHDRRAVLQRKPPHERQAGRLTAHHLGTGDRHTVDRHVVETLEELVGRVARATDGQALVLRVERGLVGVDHDESSAQPRTDRRVALRSGFGRHEVDLGHAVHATVHRVRRIHGYPRRAVDQEVEPLDRRRREDRVGRKVGNGGHAGVGLRARGDRRLGGRRGRGRSLHLLVRRGPGSRRCDRGRVGHGLLDRRRRGPVTRTPREEHDEPEHAQNHRDGNRCDSSALRFGQLPGHETPPKLGKTVGVG